ncbi:MAG: methyltransferase domain-containing protein, partial [Bacteroidetes bacterium]|nr:methyltransferase domain-containing protein [Bacteroidota bacterium]
EPFESCIALPNETPVDRILQINKEAVVQDASSQRTAALLAPLLKALPVNIKVWDCCAGSGGKSIMLYDLIPNMHLTVSDMRKTILTNLKTRFKEAGIQQYQLLLADLSKEMPPIAEASYDLVVADVPCSGSGTWGRTPEYLKYFQRDRIAYYRSLQQQILRQVVPVIKKSGYLLYITCSVFREENENNVNWLCAHHGMEKVEAQIIKGYAMKADTMFAALLKKI